MTVTYSDPVKNADINKSKAALVEIIDDLRKRFARKNDEWSEAFALATSRLELLRRYEWIPQCRDHAPQFHFCPECRQIRQDGHADDCELAEELGDE